jgi:hypothetical protein
MEFLAQLHVEVKGELRRDFPELVAKLGDLGDRDRFPIGLRYCLDVRTPPEIHPKINPSKAHDLFSYRHSAICFYVSFVAMPRKSQPLYVETVLLQDLLLEKVMGYLDYASVANLRATCQLVRGKVDDLLESNSRLRSRFRDNRTADLWLREPPPRARRIVIENKLNAGK